MCSIVIISSFCYYLFFLLSVSLEDARDLARDYGPNSWVGIAETFLVSALQQEVDELKQDMNEHT